MVEDPIGQVGETRFVMPQGDHTLLLEVITDNILRIVFIRGKQCQAPSLMIQRADKGKPAVTFAALRDSFRIQTKEITAVYSTNTQTFTYYRTNGALLMREPQHPRELNTIPVYRHVFGEQDVLKSRDSVDGLRVESQIDEKTLDRMAFSAMLRLKFQAGEALYGLGSHEGESLNLRGTEEFLYQQNYKACVPMLLSSNGYGLLFDCMSYMKFTDTAHGASMFCDTVEQLDYYIISGETPDDVVGGYRYLTGKAPMLPKWAYGYWQSKERYHSAQELLDVVYEFRKRRIPLDVIVQDWQSWPDNQWGQKSLDPARYPEPCNLTNILHREHVRLVVSIWPNMAAGGQNHAAMLEKGYLLGNRSTYNAYDADARALYWEQMNDGLFSKGVDGWWCDCTEPFEADWCGSKRNDREMSADVNVMEFKKYIDSAQINAYSLYHSSGIYKGQRHTTGSKRVVNLTRSAYAGQQRYGTITWSGDISATWDVLRRQIAAGLNFSATGNPYWTFDIGGFFISNQPNCWFWKGGYPDGCQDPGYRELYTRWLQLGVFMPVFRSHGTETPREPWRFGKSGELFYDTILRYIRLRYELMPYIYAMAAQVYHQDFTILRPLIFDSQDINCWALTDQFMFGRSLMVCPVTIPMYFESGGRKLENVNKVRWVYLPADCGWYDFHTEEYLEGGRWIEAPAPLAIIPLYVRAGSILPLTESADSTADIDIDRIRLNIYVGADSTFTLYDDAGDGYDYEGGEYSTIVLRWIDADRRLMISARRGSFGGMAEEIRFHICWTGLEAEPMEVIYHGEETIIQPNNEGAL